MPALRRQISVIGIEEFRRALNRTSYRVMTLIVPAALLILLIVVPVIRASLQDRPPPEPKPIGLVDHSTLLADRLTGTPGLRLYPTPQAAMPELLAGELDGLYVVPANYLATGRVAWFTTSGNFLGGETSNQRVRGWLQEALLADALPPPLAERALNPAQFERIPIDESGQPAEEQADASRFLAGLIFAVMLGVSLVWGGSGLLSSVAEEKETRIIETLLISATPMAILTGKTLAQGAAGLLQIAVWVGSLALVGPRLFQQIPDLGALTISPGLLAVLLVLFLLGYFIFAALLAGIGAASSTVKEASQTAALVTLPSFVPIWFLQVIVQSPNGAFARALSFIPLTAPVTMLLRLATGDVNPLEVAAVIVVLLVAAVSLLWAAARVFRAGLLLRGQPFSVPAIWRALRQAG